MILTAVLALLALAATVGAAMKLPAHYETESDVALLPSVSSSKPYGYNPYLSFSSSLTTTAQIISYQLMDPANVKKLANQGYKQSFTVSLSATVADGPILTVTVTGGDSGGVESTLHAVTDEIHAELSVLQVGIGRVDRITTLTISTGSAPKLSLSKTARPLILILGLGLGLAFAIPRAISGKPRRESPDETASLTPHDAYPPQGSPSDLPQSPPDSSPGRHRPVPLYQANQGNQDYRAPADYRNREAPDPRLATWSHHERGPQDSDVAVTSVWQDHNYKA